MARTRIRKEIRSLSPSEWNAVVRALWIMKTTSLTDGQKAYGPQFTTYDLLVAKHGHAAFDPRGDQAHFSPVFPIFHRMWLLELENSLLAIDQSISGLPYWDSSTFGSKADIFSDQYFGPIQGASPTFEITTGPFAYWPILHKSMITMPGRVVYTKSNQYVAYLKPNMPTTLNIFGYLRNPLSVNSATYLTRNGGYLCGYPMSYSHTLDTWLSCVNPLNQRSITDWFRCAESAIHSPPHMGISGTWKRFPTQIENGQCVSWFGHLPPALSLYQIDLEAFSQQELAAFPGTFIAPYALKCFQHPTSCPTQQRIAEIPRKPLFSFNRRVLLNITNNTLLGAPTPILEACPYERKGKYCGALWSSLKLLSDIANPATSKHYSNCTGTTNDDQVQDSKKCKYMNDIPDWKYIQQLGDLGDPFGSPNDPIFVFHHANVDRNFQIWVAKTVSVNRRLSALVTPENGTTAQNISTHGAVSSMLSAQNYLNFPTAGYAKGGNLRDIISSTDPFINVLLPSTSAGYASPPLNKPITVQDVLDYTFGVYQPYRYKQDPAFIGSTGTKLADSSIAAEQQQRSLESSMLYQIRLQDDDHDVYIYGSDIKRINNNEKRIPQSSADQLSIREMKIDDNLRSDERAILWGKLKVHNNFKLPPLPWLSHILVLSVIGASCIIVSIVKYCLRRPTSKTNDNDSKENV